MHIRLGSYQYELIARSYPIPHPDGGVCHGLALPDQHRVEFYAGAPASKRLAVVWHEIGHLIKDDLDITGSRLLDEESVCNLIGLAMSMICPMDLLRLHVYVCQGVDAPAAMHLPNMPCPIPVLHFSPDP